MHNEYRTSRGARHRALLVAMLALLALVVAACGDSDDAEDAGTEADAEDAGTEADAEDAGTEADAEFDLTGEQVTILVPWTSGGANDILARNLSEMLPSLLPGEPSIIVENREGGGGLVAANFFATSAPNDGTMIQLTSGLPHRELIGIAEMEFSLLEFEQIALFSEPEISYASAQSGIQNGDDLLDAEPGQVVAGGLSGGTDSKTLLVRMFNRVMGEEHIGLALGYPGAAEIRQAVRQGEVDMFAETVSAFYSSIEQDVGTHFYPIMESGITDPNTDAPGGAIRDPRLDGYDIPTMHELIEQAQGPEVWETPEGIAFQLMATATEPVRTIDLPPGTPSHIVEGWRDAFGRLLEEEDLRQELEEQVGIEITAAVGEEAEALIVGLLERASEEPEAVEILEAAVGGSD